MSTLQVISSIVLMVLSIIVVLAVLFQSEKKDSTMSSIYGGAGNYFSGTKSKTQDAKLALVTKIAGGILMVASILLVIFGA